MAADLTNRVIRVINSPNQLRLHAAADLDSDAVAFLPNETLLRIKGIQKKFYHAVVLGGGDRNKLGYVWRERGEHDGKYYVELLPIPPIPDVPPRPIPPLPYPDSPPYTIYWKWLTGGGFIAAVLAAIMYACGGPQ